MYHYWGDKVPSSGGDRGSLPPKQPSFSPKSLHVIYMYIVIQELEVVLVFCVRITKYAFSAFQLHSIPVVYVLL